MAGKKAMKDSCARQCGWYGEEKRMRGRQEDCGLFEVELVGVWSGKSHCSAHVLTRSSQLVKINMSCDEQHDGTKRLVCAHSHETHRPRVRFEQGRYSAIKLMGSFFPFHSA